VTTFGGAEPPTTASRSLRRLAHQPAVPTMYLSREADFDSIAVDRAAAVRRGYDEGYADGLARAASDAAEVRLEESRRAEATLATLARVITAVQERDVQLRAEMQSAAPKLAFELLQALLAREVSLSTNPGHDAVARALALDEGVQPVRVRMNPVDIAALTDLGLARVTSVEPDPRVEPGGALVEIGQATIDGQLGPALMRVRQVLLPSAGAGADDDRAA
jgi:flagellar assembly protein FliH